jgi:hypothetical protein
MTWVDAKVPRGDAAGRAKAASYPFSTLLEVVHEKTTITKTKCMWFIQISK